MERGLDPQDVYREKEEEEEDLHPEEEDLAGKLSLTIVISL